MAGLKDIERRIKSVKSTKKITYAMKLVSTSKLKKIQEGIGKFKEYCEGLEDILMLLVKEGAASAEADHPLLQKRAVKNVAIIVVGGARGLAGGFNANINKKIESTFFELNQKHHKAGNPISISTILLGKKASEYCNRTRKKCDIIFDELPEDPSVWPLDRIYIDIETRFKNGDVDEVYILYTQFKSALSMTPMLERVLPLHKTGISKIVPSGTHHYSFDEKGDLHDDIQGYPKILFEPSKEIVYSDIITRIYRSKILKACYETKASEHASRMTAMDAATKNASDLIDGLQLQYNKLRQSRITSELLDIIGGAEAL
jgi:F-type H+-transporting ATPase subunit gamma